PHMSQIMIAALCAGHCCSFVTTRNVPLSSMRDLSVSVSVFSSVIPAAGRSRRRAAALGSIERRMRHLTVRAAVFALEIDGHKHTRDFDEEAMCCASCHHKLV